MSARLAAALLALGLLQACASPAERLLRQGMDAGFTHRILVGQGFLLEAFSNGREHTGGVLHVYLEGDGRPWAAFDRIAADPTPRNPLMLGLMRQDRLPALYLGRPCYNGHAEDPGCSPLLWTHRRYAPEVVEAMATALKDFLRTAPAAGLVFLGHSGGGALALLLARQFPDTRAVVTIAGNADIDAWADHHGYSRLQGSLNPADFPGVTTESHYLGGKDEAVPPALALQALQKRRGAQIHIVAEAGHVQGWDTRWPEILADLP